MKCVSRYSILGVPLIVSEHCTSDEWVQARPHRKKRINKKWLKRYGRIHPPLQGMIMAKMGERRTVIYCHPRFFKKFRKLLEEQGLTEDAREAADG